MKQLSEVVGSKVRFLVFVQGLEIAPKAILLTLFLDDQYSFRQIFLDDYTEPQVFRCFDIGEYGFDSRCLLTKFYRWFPISLGGEVEKSEGGYNMADITVNQLATQTFYQIPQIFMTRTERIKDSMGKIIKKIRYTSDYAQLSNDAKLAYGALYNRCQLSIRSYESGKRDFVDEHGSVFLIFTVEELMELLDKSNKTITTVSYTHLTLPTILLTCRSRWSPYH